MDAKRLRQDAAGLIDKRGQGTNYARNGFCNELRKCRGRRAVTAQGLSPGFYLLSPRSDGISLLFRNQE